MADKSRVLKLNILADTKELVKGLDKANSEVAGASSKMGDAFKKVGIAVAAAAAAAGAFAIKYGVDAVKAASDLSETVAKTGQIFGASAKQVEAFAATAASTLGQSKQQALDAASTFAVFGKSAGLAGDDLVKFSTDFVTLASDLASFNNTSPEEAITAIGSALRGEAEPLRRYGVLLDDASLRQAALELGIVSTTKNALTPQQKVLAAQALIYKQTGDAQGDFARTSDGLANSQRILTAQIENVKTTIGTALLPIATELFQFIGSKLIPVLTDFAGTFSQKANPVIDQMRKIVSDFLLPALTGIWLFIRDYLAPMFVNLLMPAINMIITGFNYLVNIIKDNRAGLEVYLGIATRVWAFIRDSLAPILGGVLATAFNLLFRVVGDVINGFLKFFELIGKVAKLVGIDLKLSLDSGTKSVNNLNSGIVDAYKSFDSQSKTIKDEVIPSLAGVTNGYNNAAAAAGGATAATKALTAAQREQTALAKETAALRAGGALPSGISSDLKNFYRSELGLISGFGGLIGGINLNPDDPFFGFGKGGNVNQAISQLAGGSARATGQTVNINVNGTVIDPEGTARAIQELIRDTEARGGDLFDTFVGISP